MRWPSRYPKTISESRPSTRCIPRRKVTRRTERCAGCSLVLRAAINFPSSWWFPKIKASMLLNFAGEDARINARWPEYEAALKANNIKYEAYIYPKTNHGFHNDTTPRYDEAAAKLAWQRTIDHFNKTLKA